MERREELHSLRNRDIIFDYEGVIGPKIEKVDVDKRIFSNLLIFMAEKLEIPQEDASEARTNLLRKHNTDSSLFALNQELGVEIKEIYEKVYAPLISLMPSLVIPDPELGILLGGKFARKAILSNTLSEYVNAGLEAQGLTQRFCAVIAVQDILPHAKPLSGAYLTALAVTGFSAKNTIYVDDNYLNLKAPKELGFATVLISEKCQNREFADYSFADVKAFLRSV